jgi:hypothetical protein
VDIIFNPIVDTDYTGGLGNLEFAPAARVAYNLKAKWAVAAEEYADLGPLRHFEAVSNQFHEIWAVMDHGKTLNIEAGVGVGVTAGAGPESYFFVFHNTSACEAHSTGA